MTRSKTRLTPVQRAILVMTIRRQLRAFLIWNRQSRRVRPDALQRQWSALTGARVELDKLINDVTARMLARKTGRRP